MFYSPRVERVGIRELRNYSSRVVARARAGEHIVITAELLGRTVTFVTCDRRLASAATQLGLTVMPDGIG